MKHQDLLDKMTLGEKAAFLSGKNMWQTRDFAHLGIPSIFCSDGPHGVRKQAGAGDHLGLNASLPATCFPTAATVANSWDEKLGEELGNALGEEAAAQEVHVLLGPGLNIKRSPLCGRNFEYFSEDPYLAGKMAASYIRGIQSQGVYACPKHFAVNSQELRRMAMDAVVDERTLREIYLTGFEIAVKEGGAKSIMTSYNEINGVYANENKHLLQDILRREWGFDGIVITDWGASNDHAAGVAAGSNLEMPSPGLDSAREILRAVKEGRLAKEEVDACVDELLDAVLTLTEQAKRKNHKIDKEKHHSLAKRAAEESAVLLKNEEDFLPLKPGCKVAFIGDFALEPRYQGAGSSMVNPICLETLAQLLSGNPGTLEQELSGNPGVSGQESPGNPETSERKLSGNGMKADSEIEGREPLLPGRIQLAGINRGYCRNGEADAMQKKEALELAASVDVVVYCFGLDEISESEGMDRSHMRIPQNQIELLEAIAKVNPNIAGVISAGAAVEMPWAHCLKAILYGGLYGQAGAGAMLNILTGKVNPSGKLSETYPIKYEDTPAFRYFPSPQRTAEYREGIYVGYRYYQAAGVNVQYPFGHGLSYTDFAYSDLQADENGVEFTITNTGKRDGAETAQLYVGKPSDRGNKHPGQEPEGIFRPVRELKGFTKISLKAGESKRVAIPFDDKTFRYWNVKTDQWEQEGGAWKIMVGASAEDIRLEIVFSLPGTDIPLPYKREELPSYFSGQIQQVETGEFEKLLGGKIPDGSWKGELGVNDAICQMYYAKSGLARLVYRMLANKKKKSEEKGKPDLNILFIYNMPFRGIAKMTGGMVSMEMVQGMVAAVNGRLFRGMKQALKGYFANARANKQYEKKLSEHARPRDLR